MPEVFVDTNIFVDALVLTRKKADVKKLFESDKLRKIRIIISEWLLWEIAKVLYDIALERKMISMGYTSRDFSVVRRETMLSYPGLKKIRGTLSDIRNNFPMRTSHIKIKRVRQLVEAGVSFADSILLQQAEAGRCEFFITRDMKLLKLMRSMPSRKKPQVALLGLDEALQKFRS